MGKRRSFSAQFKAKVALEALVGDQTMAELASKHHLHPNMIAQWKRQARESLPRCSSARPLGAAQTMRRKSRRCTPRSAS